MLERGDLFVPHLNGEVYTQKPPLLFWAIGAASLLTGGVDETSARLPSALAAIGAVLLVFLLGERLFCRRAGFLAAAVFATCAKVLWQGRFGQIDMLLVALVTAAVWCWVAMSSRAGARDLGGGRREPLPYLFFVLRRPRHPRQRPGRPVAAAPLDPRLPRPRARTRKACAGCAWARGLLVWAAVVAAWLLPAALAGGPEYLEQIVFRQNVTRYADPWHHFQPWYYYLTVLPGDFFPWSFLLPAALVVGRREGWLRRRERHPFLFALCWVVVTVLFFSLSSAKRTVYILTMYPALALLVGAALDRAAAAWPRDRRWIAGSLGALAALCVLLAAAVPPVAARRADEVAVLGGEALVWKLTAAVGLLAAGAVAAWLLALRGKPRPGAAALAAGTAAMALGGVPPRRPRLRRRQVGPPDVQSARRQARGRRDLRHLPAPRLDLPLLQPPPRRAAGGRGGAPPLRRPPRPRLAPRPARRPRQAPRRSPAARRGRPRPRREREGYLLLRSR